MELIRSANYQEEMDGKVLPYLNGRKRAGILRSHTGVFLYYECYTPENRRRTVVILHGFSENVAKFREMIWYFMQSGSEVWLLQQRGHGRSFRGVSDPALIYIDDYRKLIHDLHFFVQRVVRAEERGRTLPLYLYAHSMGGGIGACYLERYPEVFDKAVLSSPMLELQSGGIPVWAALSFVNVKLAAGKGTDYLPGSGPFTGEYDFENSCAASPERYLYYLEQQRRDVNKQMCVTAIRTSRELLRVTQEATDPENCRRVRTPVLLFQAGKDTMVGSAGQEKFIRQIGSLGRLIRVPEAKHEIYLSADDVMEKYLKDIDAFFGGETNE